MSLMESWCIVFVENLFFWTKLTLKKVSGFILLSSISGNAFVFYFICLEFSVRADTCEL